MVATKTTTLTKIFSPDVPRTFLTLMPRCPRVNMLFTITRAAGEETFGCGRPRIFARIPMHDSKCSRNQCATKVWSDVSGLYSCAQDASLHITLLSAPYLYDSRAKTSQKLAEDAEPGDLNSDSKSPLKTSQGEWSKKTDQKDCSGVKRYHR